VAVTSIAVAAYQSLSAAVADWDQFEQPAGAAVGVIDTALIERDDDRVKALLRFSMLHGWGRGSIASAVIGVLCPPALLSGAIAGGVGDHVFRCLFRGLSHESVGELGRAFQTGPFAVVVVAERGGDPLVPLLAGSLAYARVPLRCSARDLLRAAGADEAIEHEL